MKMPKVPKVPELKEERKTGLIRGLGIAVLAGATTFFTLWTEDIATRVLISQTVLSIIIPLGGFLGWAERDVRKHNKEE